VNKPGDESARGRTSKGAKKPDTLFTMADHFVVADICFGYGGPSQ